MAETPVILPASVENLIERIREKQNQPPLHHSTIQQLALIGEQRALELLNVITKTTIRASFDGFIVHLMKNLSQNSVSPPPPPASSSEASMSPLPSPPPPKPFPSLSLSESSLSPSRSLSPLTLHPPPYCVLTALGELEFRKSFLLLSYAGEENIENDVRAEYVESLKDLPMRDFENEIWETVGMRRGVQRKDRQLYLDWDSGRTHIYQCYVSRNGSLRFKGPILQNTRTHLQKSLGDDNVLLVKFCDVGKTSPQEAAKLYGKFGKEGIRVGHRLYRFFVFKDGGKEEKKKEDQTTSSAKCYTSSVKCYFVRTESHCSVDQMEDYILSNRTMFESRLLFMHAHLLPSIDKYMARFSLILSKTYKLNIDLTTVTVQEIQDEYCRDGNGNKIDNESILTDGTGFISEDLAVLCPHNVYKGTNMKDTHVKEISNLVELQDMSRAVGETALSTHQPPLLIQCRLFHKGSAIKGTLLVNRKLPPKTIQARPSMIKVREDLNLLNGLSNGLSIVPSINSLEVVTTSQKPNRSYLSKYLIALLSYGGVPNEFFMDVLKRNLEDADHVYTKKRTALRVSVNHGEMDEYNAAAMILCGIPLDEPFLQYHLNILVKAEKNRLGEGKLYLEDCFYMMGTVDPTRTLKPNQVCIIHENGQITGDVLVYRNPGLHFGDIHIMQARYVEGLESYVGHGKYAIFFPCVGSRSVADEIAGGDFDGDMYWISKNAQLLQHFRQSDPWIESPPNSVRLSSSVIKPYELSHEQLEEELFKLYLETRFQPSSTIGAAADSWMALMDRLLIFRNDVTKEEEVQQVKSNILKLIDLYYEALDAPKKGGGKIQVPKDLIVEMYPHYMKRDNSFTSTSILGSIFDEVCRWQITDVSGIEIRKLPCFDVEIPDDYKHKWSSLYIQYRQDMSTALNGKRPNSNEEANEVIKLYKKIFNDAINIVDGSKSITDIYNEALAVYHVIYDYAMVKKDVARCGFAWKVAGSVLVRYYAEKQYQKTLICSPAVLREIFGS
ncbi:probable RNA-dependent RNA polymerase 5 [Trifolium pratense]|uniref:probable RNA-dependent RNA polymerase 5 n=1 Tax=Trifolium pratense TaxID=57577 RepID=UPI001E6935BF|nr:probable RNA-dependent RNA polymerase 5 [Trifolium pratense]